MASSKYYTLEEVLGMIYDSNTSYGFKLYKRTRTLTRHTGILVYLDGVRRFSVDFGPLGTKARLKSYLSEQSGSESLVSFRKPKTSNIQLTETFIQEINYSKESDKETVLDIIRLWYSYSHGIYNLSTNNCRDFCWRCMHLAELFKPLRCGGEMLAKAMLVSTVNAGRLDDIPTSKTDLRTPVRKTLND